VCLFFLVFEDNKDKRKKKIFAPIFEPACEPIFSGHEFRNYFLTCLGPILELILKFIFEPNSEPIFEVF